MMTCPKCLGSEQVFNPQMDDLEICNYCEGIGTVSDVKFENFDPIMDEDYDEI